MDTEILGASTCRGVRSAHRVGDVSRHLRREG
jgi:hypothetical protein